MVTDEVHGVRTSVVCNRFGSGRNAVISKVVRGYRHNNIIMGVRSMLTFLPRSLAVPKRGCVINCPLHTLLGRILIRPHGRGRLVLSHISAAFIRQLFRLRIPRIFRKLIRVGGVTHGSNCGAGVIITSASRGVSPINAYMNINNIHVGPVLGRLNNRGVSVVT